MNENKEAFFDENQKYELRSNSRVPVIKRLKMGENYVYVIKQLYGCDCGYAGCENYSFGGFVMRVRDIKTQEIILTKKGDKKLKMSDIKDFPKEMESYEIFKNNY